MKIQETQTFKFKNVLLKKIYSKKVQLDKLEQLINVARNRDIQFMINTQHPNSIQLGIVKDIING